MSWPKMMHAISLARFDIPSPWGPFSKGPDCPGCTLLYGVLDLQLASGEGEKYPRSSKSLVDAGKYWIGQEILTCSSKNARSLLTSRAGHFRIYVPGGFRHHHVYVVSYTYSEAADILHPKYQAAGKLLRETRLALRQVSYYTLYSFLLSSSSPRQALPEYTGHGLPSFLDWGVPSPPKTPLWTVASKLVHATLEHDAIIGHNYILTAWGGEHDRSTVSPE